MGVYIPGMEMPTSCDGCWALDDDGDYPRCRITNEQRGYNFPIREQRMGKCPLVPVPEHGRLIDADFLLAEYDKIHVGKPGGARLLIANAPTIIPESTADKEGEG